MGPALVSLGVLAVLLVGGLACAPDSAGHRRLPMALTLAVVMTVIVLLMLPAAMACAQTVPAGALKHRAELTRTARSVWGLDAPVATFAAQVHQESAWRADAVSRVGAKGLTQFMPATATWIAATFPQALGPADPFNPSWAMAAMVRYDLWLYERTPVSYGLCDRMWVVLRAYNGGLGHWQAEARATGLQVPTRHQVDAACGQARRAALHCRENLGYPERILTRLEPVYEAAGWGGGACP